MLEGHVQNCKQVELAVKTIIQMEGAWAVAQVEAVANTWDGEVRSESKWVYWENFLELIEIFWS